MGTKQSFWITARMQPRRQICHFFASVHATTTWLRAFFIVGIVFAACSLLFWFGTIIVSLKKKPSEEQRSDEKVPGTGGNSTYKHFLTLPVGCVSPPPPIESLLHIFNFVR
jgi:hypothetical protein